MQTIAQNITTGSVAVGTSAVQVSTETSSIKVIIKAALANTGILYIGKLGVTANSAPATDGYELTAGTSIEIEIGNPAILYVIASAITQKAFFTILK
jgi:hypothetical protein